MCLSESTLKLSKTVFNIAGYTKLIVIGGYNNGYLSSVEVIDLENPSNTCNTIADYPVKESGIAVGFIDGLIKSCGSSDDTADCYDYNPATNSWITSVSLINERLRPRYSFIDGIWLVSRDGTGYDDVGSTTKMWTGTGFEPGPSLPIPMWSPCQLTINSTHVFFADTYFTGNTYS